MVCLKCGEIVRMNGNDTLGLHEHVSECERGRHRLPGFFLIIYGHGHVTKVAMYGDWKVREEHNLVTGRPFYLTENGDEDWYMSLGMPLIIDEERRKQLMRAMIADDYRFYESY
jgi:hypothetical protein